MDQELYYSTSQAAAEWGVSQQRVVDLCKAGLVDCETTQGGHYRISDRVVQKHKTGGLPLLPRRLPQANGKARDGQPGIQNGRQDLLAPPSDNLVASREQRVISEHEKTISENDVTVVKNRAAKRQAEWELAQIEEKFQQRDQAKALRAAELERQQKRPAWMRKWVTYAVDSMPDGARGEYEPAVVKAANTELAAMSPDYDDTVVRAVMDATVRKVLRKYYWLRDAADASLRAKEVLPSELRNYWPHLPPTEWEDKAVSAASLAICEEAELGNGELNYLSFERMEEIAVAAGVRVVAEYRSQIQAQAESERRRQVKERVTGPLYPRLEGKHKADADCAIDRALAGVPPDAEDDELTEVAQAAAAPWKHQLDEADERQRQRDEQERRRSAREWAKLGLSLKLPYSFPDELRKQAMAAMEQAVDDTDTADSSRIDAAIEEALRPYLERDRAQKQTEQALRERQQQADERQRIAERRVDSFADVSAVYRMVEELERKGEIDSADFNENWALAKRLVERINPALVNVLVANPRLTDEQIHHHLDRLVDRYLDECLDSGPAAA